MRQWLVGFLEECFLIAEVASGFSKEVVGLGPQTQLNESLELFVVDAGGFVDEIATGKFLSLFMNVPQPQGEEIPKAKRTDEQGKAIHWREHSPRQ